MLMRLPLFQGMSQDHLFEIIEQATFRFSKVGDGKTAFAQGEGCNRLTFLMGGELTATTQAPHAELSLEETIKPYAVIEPQSLFGKRPSYKATYTARGEASLLSIDKQYVYALIGSYEIFRINLLNLFGSRVEDLCARQWAIKPQPLEGRLISFVHTLCTTSQGSKTVHVKMEELAQLLDCTRLSISNILNKWKEEGYIAMRRKEFVIHDMARLLEKSLQE